MFAWEGPEHPPQPQSNVTWLTSITSCSGSESLALTPKFISLILRVCPSFTLYVRSSLATGGSFTGVMLIVTVPFRVHPLPSFCPYVNVSVWFSLPSCWYLNAPSWQIPACKVAGQVNTPWEGFAITTAVRLSPSGSTSGTAPWETPAGAATVNDSPSLTPP